ncbi:MAG: hypothetical protein B9S38_03140 [Verrucomicrobiia bacterium Tous-C4TDCM]|nr:MAG: hypothetical protein B9S38_03140 [Verrucomicrobiae bacterium Tous-C4TDCM]
MKILPLALALLALLTLASRGQVLIDDAMEGYPTATATSVVSNAATSNPASWQTVVFSASGAVTATAGIGTANGKNGRAAVMSMNFSTAGNQWAGAILNSAAYTTPATLGTSLSNFQFTVDLRGTQASAVTVAFLSYSASAQLTGSMEKTFALTAANTYQTFSGDLGQNGWAPDSSKLSGAPLVLNVPRYGWSVVVHAEGNSGWGFDPDESPYVIQLTGRVLSFSSDTDADGLSDAAEYTWRALAFDWQVSQPAMVAAFFADANRAGLYTASQVQALHIGTPLIARNPATGQVKLTIGVKKSTDLTSFLSLPLTSGSTVVNGLGELEFTFTPPDNAAFFRLESR